MSGRGKAAWMGRQQTRRRRRIQRLLVVAVTAVAIAGAVGYLGRNYGWSTTTAVGRPAPRFVLPDHEGRPVALADYLERKPVVLVFYMTYG